MSKKLKYIDLFSGPGGFSLGFDNKGFQNVFSIDIEPSFCETYKYNFPEHQLIQKDICELTNDELKYLKEFIRVVKVIQPKYFVMENVARLLYITRALLEKKLSKILNI